MTVDMTFWYKTKLYYLDCIDHEYAILTEDWKPLAKDSNFLRLLHKPIKQWRDKSFYELIDKILFKNYAKNFKNQAMHRIRAGRPHGVPYSTRPSAVNYLILPI